MNEAIWLSVGFVGQACFFIRFFIQWISSERQKRVIIPIAFWYFSIAGGIILLTYAIYRRDPVFIFGQSTGIFIYLRNLYFSQKERKKNYYKKRE